jgi:threonylcarbamoyladenosine tRNA methylthiotransferase MtaB
MSEARTVAFHTLGCKLNFSETSALSRLLGQEGFEQREFNDEADVYVINTCSVTENADRECRQLVRRIQRRTPDAFVVITGCYAQLKPTEIASIPGVDLVLGAAEKFNIAAHLRDLTRGDSARICSCDIEEVAGFNASYSVDDRTRTFLKVQDGCDYTCSFCTIPMARGKSRSDRIENVVRQARILAEKGVREIVLTGVNLGDFGKRQEDTAQGDEDFLGLCQALEEVDGIDRFRISSIEPNLLSPEIIEHVAASRRFMPHFHIPLQSGSDRILGLMRRRYRRALYAERIAHIRSVMPHAGIGVDVITGFPSESDDDFRDTFEFLHELDVSYLHVFTYSERDDTKALDIKPVVPVHIRQERNKTLRNLSYMKLRHFTERHAGQTRPVLFEHQDRDGMMEGYTDNYIRVKAPFRHEWVNQIVEWRV